MVNTSLTRQNNVSFVALLSPGNRSEPKLFGIVAIKAIKNIDREDELDTSYGIEYTLSNARPKTESQ